MEHTKEEEEEGYARWAPVRLRVLVLVASAGLLPAVTQTMYLPTVNEVISDLDTSEELVAWTLSVYALGSALFPMCWGSLSDKHGRRTVLLAGFAIFCAAGAFSAYAWNVEVLIAGRVFQSLGLSAAAVVGAGSIADVYPPAIRGNAMGWYSAMALTGAVVGPVAGGFVGQYFGWRAIFGSMAVVAGFLMVMIVFLLPETLSKTGPRRSSNPIHALKLFLDPTLLALFLEGGVAGGCLLLVLFIFPIQMKSLYGLTDSKIGMAYVPFGLATVAGILSGGKAADACFRITGLGGRLIPCIIGTLCGMGSLILFAFTIERSYWLSMASISLMGFSNTFSRPGRTTFAVEQCPQSAASVQACISSFSSLSGFVVLNAGPVVIARTSIRWAFAGYALLIVGVSVTLSLLAWTWLGVYKITSNTLNAPSSITDNMEEPALAVSEMTPLKLGLVTPAKTF